ncbi:MAG: DNA replication/repair protein RecF [Spirochaetaceae bacterium]
MGFESVRTYNFRNLADTEIEVSSPRVFLVGENGQGKTNFLETIYVLCYGASFRTRRDERLCREGADRLKLLGRLTDPRGERHEIVYGWGGGKKTIRLNGKSLVDRKDLVFILPCIIFAHDDIEFVYGAPERQRFFFDQTLSLYDPLFIDVLRNYRRILRERNAALKQGRLDLLDVYDRRLAEAGCEMLAKRREAVSAFNETFSRLFSRVSGFEEPMHIEYRPSWRLKEGSADTEAAIEQLYRRRERDRVMTTTTSGPHRDRFIFRYRGADFTETASTGQLRLVSLILRVAQAGFFASRSGRRPVLLLDDVLLELDPLRRGRFLEALPSYEQAFFTFLPDERFTDYAAGDTLIYRVRGGTIMPYGTGG